MSIKTLEINGIRSFSQERTIDFAIPNGQPGSGLTIIVGANNSGKSSIIECLNIISKNKSEFPQELRNNNCNSLPYITLETNDNKQYKMVSVEKGSGFIYKFMNREKTQDIGEIPLLIFSTKRFFSSNFNSYRRSMLDYAHSLSNNFRDENNSNNEFGERLIDIYNNNLEEYRREIKYILPNIPNWTVDAKSENVYEIRFLESEASHNSNGAGSGVNNIFVLVDGYLNTNDNTTIVIDEPELSLHPDVQERIFSRLIEISKTKQIILTTHSPYFVDYKVLENGGKIIRTVNINNSTEIYELNQEFYKDMDGLIHNDNNPHIFGTRAKEILFFNDNLILVEGQDDVICYQKIFNRYGFYNHPKFYGWGVGSFSNFDKILTLIKKLGYRKVFCIADGDENARNKVTELREKYRDYVFFNIDADDVRNKPDKKELKKINKILKVLNEKEEEDLLPIKEYFKSKIRIGLVDSIKTCNVKPEYEENIKELVTQIKKYFSLQEIPIIEENTCDKLNDG